MRAFSTAFVASVIAFCFLAGRAGANVTVQTNVTKSSVRIAEPFEVEIVAYAPRGTKLHFPVIGDRLGNFDVLRQSDAFDVPDAEDPQLRSWSRRITLEAFDTGQLRIPSLEIGVIGVRSQNERLRTKSHGIQVVSVLEDRVDPASFRDIRDVVDVETQEPTSYAWIGWIVASAVGLAWPVILAVAVARRKRWMTPAKWARQELEKLQSGDSSDLMTPEVISSIESVVRTYLEKEFDVPATTYTADQVVSALVRWDATSATCEQVRSLLGIAERAKFAGLDLSQSELASAIQDAQMLIEELEVLDADLSREDA